MPAWLSSMAAIAYHNERLTPRLIIGGALITAANVLIQFEAMRKQPHDGQRKD
jgi:drug/metabolite transporter (DMT)-like permease